MMKGLYRVALVTGLVAMSATSVSATEIRDDEVRDDTNVYVVNNHLTDVRVFAEDANGRLHNLGRVARGSLQSFDVPEALSGEEFRIKVFPTSTAWSPIKDDYGVKTNPLDAQTDREVRIWLEADLTKSLVEIAR